MSTMSNKNYQMYTPAAAAMEGMTSYEQIPLRNFCFVGVFAVMSFATYWTICLRAFVGYFSMTDDTDSWLVGGPDTKVGGCLL